MISLAASFPDKIHFLGSLRFGQHGMNTSEEKGMIYMQQRQFHW